MINETVLFLTYYFDPNDDRIGTLKYVKRYLNIYLPFDLYFHEPLTRTFSNVILCDYLKKTAEMGITAVNEEIIEIVQKEHPKYVLWTSWQYDILESTLEKIGKEGAIVVGWFFDDAWRFDNYSKYWIPCLDYCVTNHGEAVPRYKAYNARVIHAIPNTGIAVPCDWSNMKEEYEVSFIGTRLTAGREEYINEIKKNDIPCHLFGNGWGGYIPFKMMIEIFGTSKINLNFSRTLDYFQMKGRIFQVCLAGGFLLTEHAPGIEKYFEIDKEIVCFRNASEMIDKINYYLIHDDERRAIARAGWERAVNNYTSFHVVSKVFQEIEKDHSEHKKAPPRKIKMPIWIRIIPSKYHFDRGRGFLEENYKGLWKEALRISLSYNPLNLGAWYYYLIGFISPPLRPAFFRLYRLFEKFGEMIRSAPILGEIRRKLAKRLLYP
ncbi:MAG: glycosyltransferase family 1 protein [Nitrospirae bacterium]|nr:glycosyltransferase family 1 protein [Nitrospirota bacterium]